MRPPVTQFSARADGAVPADELHRILGRVTSHVTVPLHQNVSGTALALAGGTLVSAPMAAAVDFGDAGADLARLVIYGTPPTHALAAQVYNVTTGKVLATVNLPAGGSTGIQAGVWTQFTPFGGDEHLEMHFQGTGTDGFTLHSVHLQLATLNAKG